MHSRGSDHYDVDGTPLFFSRAEREAKAVQVPDSVNARDPVNRLPHDDASDLIQPEVDVYLLLGPLSSIGGVGELVGKDQATIVVSSGFFLIHCSLWSWIRLRCAKIR